MIGMCIQRKIPMLLEFYIKYEGKLRRVHEEVLRYKPSYFRPVPKEVTLRGMAFGESPQMMQQAITFTQFKRSLILDQESTMYLFDADEYLTQYEENQKQTEDAQPSQEIGGKKAKARKKKKGSDDHGKK